MNRNLNRLFYYFIIPIDLIGLAWMTIGNIDERDQKRRLKNNFGIETKTGQADISGIKYLEYINPHSNKEVYYFCSDDMYQDKDFAWNILRSLNSLARNYSVKYFVVSSQYEIARHIVGNLA